MTTFGIRRSAYAVAAAATLGAVLAACGSSSSSGASAPSTGATGTGGLQTRTTSIGTVLVNSAGRTLYELEGNTAAHQTCTGGCLAIWPPVRVNGQQMVVNGHPAFTFVQDASAGQTRGQGAQDEWGHWFALDANGNPISGAAAPSSAASSSGGGYSY